MYSVGNDKWLNILVKFLRLGSGRLDWASSYEDRLKEVKLIQMINEMFHLYRFMLIDVYRQSLMAYERI